MSPAAIAAVIAAGLLAGAVNAIVGSGSLITFPTLLAIGYPPVVANVSNTVGLVFGSVSGAIGYRRELAGQGRRIAALAVPAIAGGILGAVLLLVLPQSVFHRVVPVLIILAIVLVIVQPQLSALMARRRARQERQGPGAALPAGVFGTAVYGGYFGAAQGVILISVLGLVLDDTLQRLNGLKNVLAAAVNGVAAVYFVFFAHVAWAPAVLIAVSSIAGGQLGALVGRRLAPGALRVVIVVAGTAAVVKLLA
ncbi:MAG: sulfite exporter TauE/SafE family protein [Candidatus Dormibacteraceae bacterium]